MRCLGPVFAIPLSFFLVFPLFPNQKDSDVLDERLGLYIIAVFFHLICPIPNLRLPWMNIVPQDPDMTVTTIGSTK
ncbi:hypothetical protein A0H81_09787 [Grifola frondosa]|uniref:Uncharacterized protein n=1 Tax=Grifola frondosa TaxID=5627 RepID=A0A1C7LZZ5_GRIFR|nr:hypothetical protein A0H81_09787 [Grifola frondosa]